MSDHLEWRERLENAHKQMHEAMTELITNKNYSEAERRLHYVDQLMIDLIGRDRRPIRFMGMICWSSA
jgi:hypothetical protein